MRLTGTQARARFDSCRVARLATAGADRRPHLVPVTFAVDGDIVATAIDQKPKTTLDLRRLRNIRENPLVCLLADHYDDDWSRLWWVRADGRARIVARGPEADPDRIGPLAWLTAKYPQYQAQPPAGPVIMVTVDRWTGWQA